MQIELRDHKLWRTWLELSNAMFDCIEILCRCERYHSNLVKVSPVELEASQQEVQTAQFQDRMR